MSGRNLKVNLVANTSQFKSAMSETSNQIKLLNSEFKNASSETDQYGNKLDNTGAKKKQLTGVIQQYQTRIKAITNEQKHWTSELEKGNITEEEHAQKQQELARRLNNTEGEMKRYEGQLKRLNSEGKNTKMTFEEFDKQFREVGQTMATTGAAVGAITGGMFTAIVKPMKDAVEVTKDFDTEMSKVQALTGATADEFGQMRQMAKDLGAATSFSASEAASAISFLGMAGFETNEILDATPGLLNLAASAQMDLGRAADIASNIISGFSMEASEAGKVSDVLARASSNANTNVEQMGDSMATVAPIASTLGMSLEDMASGTMIMSDAGLQGSQAGRMLRQGLLRLAKPTGEAEKLIKKLGVNVFDADGNMKSLDKVVLELEKGMKGMSKQSQTAALATLFGSESTAGWSALLAAGSSTLKDYTADLENSEGAAADMAKTMRDNLAGSMDELESGLEGLQIRLGERLMPTIRGSVDWLTDLVGKIDELDDATVETIAQTALFAAGVLGVTTAVAGLVAGIGALMMFAGPIGLAIVGGTALLGALGLGIFAVQKHTENLQEAQKEAKQDALNYGENLSEGTKKAVSGYRDLYDEAKIKMAELKYMSGDEAKKTVKEINAAFAELGDMVKAELESQGDTLTQAITKVFAVAGEAGQKEAEEINKSVMDIINEKIDNHDAAIKRIIEIQDEYGSNMSKMPKAIREDYLNALNAVDEGMQTFAKSQEEMDSIVQAVADSKGAISNKIMQGHLDKLSEAYAESTQGVVDWRNDVVGELEQGLAQGHLTQKEFDKAMLNADASVNKMLAETAGKRAESLRELAKHLDDRGELLDIATGKELEREQVWETIGEGRAAVTFKRLETDEEYLKRWLELTEETLDSAETFSEKSRQIMTDNLEEYISTTTMYSSEAIETTDKLVDEQLASYGKGKDEAHNAGKEKGEAYVEGIYHTKSVAQKSAAEIVESSLHEMAKGIFEARTSGKEKGLEHHLGLLDTIRNNELAGIELSETVTEELGKTTDGGGGNKAGSQLNFGLNAWKERVKNTGKSVAESGKAGLASVGTSSVGADFVSGFSGAIKSRTGVGSAVWGVAGALGRSALSGLKAAIKSQSPSKLTGEEGINFTDGFSLAIDKGKKDAVQSASLVGKESLEALNNEVTGFKQSFGAIALAVEDNKQILKVEHTLDNKFDEFVSMFKMFKDKNEEQPITELLNATLEQNQILMQLLQKTFIAEVAFDSVYNPLKTRLKEDEYSRNKQRRR